MWDNGLSGWMVFRRWKISQQPLGTRPPKWRENGSTGKIFGTLPDTINGYEYLFPLTRQEFIYSPDPAGRYLEPYLHLPVDLWWVLIPISSTWQHPHYWSLLLHSSPIPPPMTIQGRANYPSSSRLCSPCRPILLLYSITYSSCSCGEPSTAKFPFVSCKKLGGITTPGSCLYFLICNLHFLEVATTL